jgi:hypothetical protein
MVVSTNVRERKASDRSAMPDGEPTLLPDQADLVQRLFERVTSWEGMPCRVCLESGRAGTAAEMQFWLANVRIPIQGSVEPAYLAMVGLPVVRCGCDNSDRVHFYRGEPGAPGDAELVESAFRKAFAKLSLGRPWFIDPRLPVPA